MSNVNDKRQPEITVPETIPVMAAESSALSNGVGLHVLDCSQQEVVRVSFVFRAGTSLQSAPFSASATANLLSEGTANFSARQVAERLDFYGSFFEVSLDRDYAVVTFVSLSKFFGQTMEMAREILLRPLFDPDEIAIYCGKRKQRLVVERSKPSFRARELFGAALFGKDHPYGVSYPESGYDGITHDILAQFYARRYTAENCFVVCSGRITAHERELIAALAQDIPTGGEVGIPRFPATPGHDSLYDRHEGAVQSAIRTGRLLFPRSHPDFVPMQVVSTVLGGYFGSRLVHNLREERGYTYGVYAAMVNLEHAGYMAIGTEVGTEATEDALRQIFVEMERLRNELVTHEELQMVKNTLTGEVMRVLDGPFGIADVTIENIQNGTDNTYIDTFLSAIRGITPEQVRSTAHQYLDPALFTTVIVGDDMSGGSFGLQ